MKQKIKADLMAVGTNKKKKTKPTAAPKGGGVIKKNVVIKKEAISVPGKKKKLIKTKPAGLQKMGKNLIKKSSELRGEADNTKKLKRKRKLVEDGLQKMGKNLIKKSSELRGEADNMKKLKRKRKLVEDGCDTTLEAPGAKKKKSGKQLLNKNSVKIEMTAEEDGKKKKKIKLETPQEGSSPNKNGNRGTPVKGRKKKKKGKVQPVVQDEPQGKVKAQTALEYLKKWKNDRPNWKFLKVQQIWMSKNILFEHRIPDKMFPLWLEYMEASSQGQKEHIVKYATNVADSLGKKEAELAGELVTKYNRARMIVQTLSVDEK